ncbi:hypothetical protein TD95_000410 [Thielaviopsis punctulata]|uniref:N-acetyltransferase domain-containing protein n=1 Tax=Thielaviopsis punctulata TaxID=72032 RepID=A0A0F4ZJ19_9PEZI|nr:hypothetical protein TD95_000410 [Thielaviopsis punctulata]
MPSFLKSSHNNAAMPQRPNMERLDSSASTIVDEEAHTMAKCSLLPSSYRGLRKVGRSEYKHVALSLSHAFANDELSRYMVDLPDMENRTQESMWKLHYDMMKYVSACYIRGGEVSTIGPDYESIAMWVRPGDNPDTRWNTFRSGLWKLKFKLSREGKNRYYKEVIPALHDTKAKIMGERDNDCYYLIYLGTKESGRCKGYAATLLRDMMQKADQENKPMYLESSSPANTEYYKKFGFVPLEDIPFGPNKFLTAMVREPQLHKVTSSDSSGASTLNEKN